MVPCTRGARSFAVGGEAPPSSQHTPYRVAAGRLKEQARLDDTPMSIDGLEVATTSAATIAPVEETHQDVVAVGGDDQSSDRQAHRLGRPPSANTLPKLPVGRTGSSPAAVGRHRQM